MNLQNNKIAFVFPGQGSQEIGMGKSLAEAYPVAAETFKQADEILGFKLSKLAWEGPKEELDDTANTQPALFVHSIAAWQVFKEIFPTIKAEFTAGHSMGELSALAAANSFSFEEGLNLVKKRGELMKQAGEISPGKMAAFLGLDIETTEKILQETVQDGETLQVANDNCPGQIVVSGSIEAIERVIPSAKEAGAKRAVPLAVSIAAHSELMRHAQHEFTNAIQETQIKEPTTPVIGNVSAKPLTSVEEIKKDLQAQLTSRVRWTETIQYLLEEGVDTFVELGTGNVLCGLIRRIEKEVFRIPFGKPSDITNI